MAILFFCVIPLLIAQVDRRPVQPDFSGEWMLVSSTAPSADVVTALNIRQPITDQTVQGTPMPPAYFELLVERRSTRGVQREKYAIGVVSGTVAGTRSTEIEERGSVNWAGDRLVIVTSGWFGSGASRRLVSERSETWQIESGNTLVIAITEKIGQRETRTILRYRRRA